MALDALHDEFPEFEYELVAWAEIDPDAIKMHNAVYPQWADRNLGDMTKIDWTKVPDFDLLTYSTPCQSISQAGLQHGFAEGSGTRSSIIWYVRDALKIKKPKYAMLENVAAMVSAKFLPFFNLWRSEVDRLGYENFAEILNAKNYGIPQNRERIFLISILRTEEEPYPQYYFPEPQKLDKCLADMLEEDVEERFFLKDEMVEKFLRTNETTPKVYKVTDRFLTDEEIESLVAEHKEEPKAEPDEIFPEETNPFEC